MLCWFFQQALKILNSPIIHAVSIWTDDLFFFFFFENEEYALTYGLYWGPFHHLWWPRSPSPSAPHETGRKAFQKRETLHIHTETKAVGLQNHLQ